MPAISRSTLYQFERLATARDRMPTAIATGGRVYSSFTSAAPRAATWWWTNERGDLRLFRSSAINVLQTLQAAAGAEIDRYWGSQTRTRLMQYTGLSDAPSAPVPMRTLLEAALARSLESLGFGPGTVVIPQLAEFPPIDAPRGTFVGGVVQGSDNLLYWDGARGVFQATEAPPVVNVPPTPAAPAPTPAAPVTGRIAIVIRPINLPTSNLAPGVEPLTWSPFSAPAPLVVVDQQASTERLRVVVDAPGGTAIGFNVDVRRPDGSPYPQRPSIPLTFRGGIQQNIEMTFDAATSALTVVRTTDVPINSPSPDGTVATPMSIQQAGIFGGSPVVAVAVVAVLMGSLYLWDRSRPPSKRILRIL